MQFVPNRQKRFGVPALTECHHQPYADRFPRWFAFGKYSFQSRVGMNAKESVLPRIQHVTITFPPGQEARVRSFYTGALGLREKPTPKVVKPLGWIWFDTGISGVELHCVPDEQPIPADTRHHFCLEIDDLARQRASLIDWGAKIVEARALPLAAGD
jgi:Glyoxalase-like domain